ncbi:MAG: tRNA uridine-5-carboxymethylaminomethyl(34) synthesis GTPase MnmE [Planctomycetota bacterium]|jgi:tRNA modification GTPase
MYELTDTIAAVSSPGTEQKVIVRISGPRAIDVVNTIFEPKIERSARRLISGYLHVDDELSIEARLYVFRAPHSYTGQDLVEIHYFSNSAVTKLILDILLSYSEAGIRAAEPGEFTARAYMNGKLDLAQAEAVGEIIASSNRFQLAAAKELFTGQLAKRSEKIRSSIMECLSLLEVGLDFSGEDIEFISSQDAVRHIKGVKEDLEQLLAGGIRFETIVDLPAVAIVGAANAGKSSLVNSLLGTERSIVSQARKTTRDVLSGQLVLEHNCCVLFDCAGLLIETDNLLDELAQAAAVEAIRKSAVVVFCVDAAKTDLSEDLEVHKIIESKRGMGSLIAVAAKSDLINEKEIESRCSNLSKLFFHEFIPLSSKKDAGLEKLRSEIDDQILRITVGNSGQGLDTRYSITLTSRHRQVVVEATENLGQAIGQLSLENEEVAVMFLRSTYQQLSEIRQPQVEDIDEQILGQIFSRFCIGK